MTASSRNAFRRRYLPGVIVIVAACAVYIAVWSFFAHSKVRTFCAGYAPGRPYAPDVFVRRAAAASLEADLNPSWMGDSLAGSTDPEPDDDRTVRAFKCVFLLCSYCTVTHDERGHVERSQLQWP